ncbi:TPA: hypothetical protein ACGW13_002360 [Stenotrophomonas maltophilia]|uniref:hypothetical protein n=1 Tax=Stenotrophomonas maltophilia TaxID=40324 RepID=UPI00066C6819|nr:hypothetical protein [Stenotrophomonas maltophilia]EKT4101710.1 hypothetical protein [Stenotrophomonas maltophilia]MBA0316165.1 hypothetical protein [Stenotrophomonas maltophilia]MBH1669174.1 hypothetical protein [Stenotrophomonas maltophilia]OWQ59789.1 hypothetical protein CEE59_05855 [Stenotrophomonas maltophilia]PZS83109.1 hypothetical protein A7X74_08105 [Stenotrophomonas maltophilia]
MERVEKELPAVQERHADVWAELLLYSFAAFCTGLLLGTVALVASDKGASTDWGSYADWLAALGGVVAAFSTIVIAGLARKELMRREQQAQDDVTRREQEAQDEAGRREQEAIAETARRQAEFRAETERVAGEERKLAIAIAYGPVAADAALAARVTGKIPLSFRYDFQTVTNIVEALTSFVTPDEIANPVLIKGLPHESLRAILVARGQMKLIHKTAKGLERSLLAKRSGNTEAVFLDELSPKTFELEVNYLVAATEHMLSGLIPTATQLHEEAGAKSDMPWSRWKAKRDFGEVLRKMDSEYDGS